MSIPTIRIPDTGKNITLLSELNELLILFTITEHNDTGRANCNKDERSSSSPGDND